MISPGLIKTFVAGAAVRARRIVRFGTSDTAVLEGTAATTHLGISEQAADAASGDRVDVILSGTAELVLGGTVTRGDWICSDANGAGVTAAPAAGVNQAVVGIALASGVSGDIIPVAVTQSRVQG